ncbi:MAG: lysylphosphatidylglycerol synthase transmembrane domain-containing protein [Elusimicrobiota bacterium]
MLRIAVKCIGLVIFALIVCNTDWKKLYVVFSQVNPVKLVPIYLLIIPNLLAIGYKWHSVLRKLAIKRTFYADIRLYFSGMLVGIITPGRLGELYPAIRLGKEGYSKMKVAFSILLTRFFDFTCLSAAGIVSLYIFFSSIMEGKTIVKTVLWSAFGVMALIIIGVFLFKEHINNVVVFILRKLFKLQVEQNALSEGLSGMDIELFIKIVVLTLFFWGTYFYQMYLFGHLIGVDLPFFTMFGLLALVSLAAALPITMIGLGTREFAMISLLAVFGGSREQALALSLMSYSIMLVNVVIATVFWMLEHGKD